MLELAHLHDLLTKLGAFLVDRGGRADMAQGGGPEGGKAVEALAAVRSALEA